MAQRKLWAVVYRTGGTANFQWRRTLAYGEYREVVQALNEVLAMGYKAHIADYNQSLVIGLPETYDVSDPIC